MKRLMMLAMVASVACAGATEKPWVVENEDNDHYYYYDPSRMTKEALEAYADELLDGGYVTHVFWCANGERPSYDSKAWDPIWTGLSDPKTDWGNGKRWAENAKLLHDRGIDPYKVWIDRTRAKGASPWVSMRMNDVHWCWIPNYFCTMKFRSDHPEYRVMPGYKGEMWEPYSLDYAIPEVREHHLKLVKELTERYDADGIELDFLRTATYFAPGEEEKNAPILTEFVRKCREYADAAGKRRGRKMMVAIRVLPTPEESLAHGLDAVAIAKAGVVDVIIPCNSSPAHRWDLPWEEWQRTIGAAAPQVRLVAGTTVGYGDKGRWHDEASLRGWSATMRAKGAKDIYFFNLHWASEKVRKSIHPGAGTSPENVKRGARSFLVEATLPPLKKVTKPYKTDFVKAAFKPDGWRYSANGGEARKFAFAGRTNLRLGAAPDGKDYPVLTKVRLEGELVAERDGEAALGMGLDWRGEMSVNGKRIFGRNELVDAQDACRFKASDWTVRVPVKKGSNRVVFDVTVGENGFAEVRSLDPAELKDGVDLVPEEEYWHYVKLGHPKPPRLPPFPASVAKAQRFTRELPPDVKAEKSVSVELGFSGKAGVPAAVYLNGVKSEAFVETTPATGREARYTFPLSALKGGANEITTDPSSPPGANITWASLSLDLP